MSPIFEYDVFLSFASADEEFVKPVWQELCLSGLRVFWSDAALKKELGRSWMELIESSLDKSRHMVLVCSPASMSSEWVRREYGAFLSQCYKPGVRRLIPVLTRGYRAEALPLFLRQLQARPLEDHNALKEVISALGGVNIEELKDENHLLKQQLESLSLNKRSLEREVNELKTRLSESDTMRQATRDAEPGARSLTNRPHTTGDDYQTRAHAEFELLGLPPDASSGAILQRYESLRDDYEGLLNNCPKGLREVCLARLYSIEAAFKLVFPERKKEEDEKLKSAYELLQLPEETILAEVITERYEALKSACLKAMQSYDPIVKKVAAEELAKLDAAYRILMPKTTPPADDLETTGHVVEVIMPQMGESIAEGTIMLWLKKVGEHVERDEPLYEISTDKVDAEIPSPAAGILGRILFAEGSTVAVNTAVAHIFEQTKGDKLSAAIEAGKHAYREEKRKTESTS